MRQINTGKPHTEETKKKISATWKRKGGPPNKGKSPSEETRRKISETCKGFKMPEEAKQKISIATKGAKNPSAILKEEDVIEIKKLLREGQLSQVAIGKLFGISNHTIHKIYKGKLWKHITI